MRKVQKHFIGIGLFVILLIFFYTYSFIVFSISNESTKLIEYIFVAIYMCFLIALTLFYVKNDLLFENILLLIFSLVFANHFVLGLIYFPITVLFEGTSAMEEVNKYFYAITYPFDIFYSDISFVMIFLPIIPLISLIILIKRKPNNTV